MKAIPKLWLVSIPLTVLLGCGENQPIDANEMQRKQTYRESSIPGNRDSADNLTCQEVMTCAKACAPSDIACITQCQGKGCATAKTTFMDLSNCLINNCQSSCQSEFGSNCEKCLFQNCANSVSTCMQNTCPPPPPKLNCNEVLTCAKNCTPSDIFCITQCQGKGCATAKETFMDLSNCLINNCQSSCQSEFGSNCEKCLFQNCANSVSTCMQNTCLLPPTKSNCQEIMDCVKTCTPGDIPCLTGCHGKGCSSAQSSSMALFNCMLGSCSTQCQSAFDPACESCLSQNCGNHLSDCMQNTCPPSA